MRECRAGIFQQNARIALVGKPSGTCEVNHHGASDSEQQKCGVNVPASPQRTADHAGPAVARTCLAVGQRAGHTRDEHEHFRAIAEAVIPQRQPAADVVGDMVQKDEPERDAAANINAQVPARLFQLRQRAHQWLRNCREPRGLQWQLPTAQRLGVAFDLLHRPQDVGVRRGYAAVDTRVTIGTPSHRLPRIGQIY